MFVWKMVLHNYDHSDFVIRTESPLKYDFLEINDATRCRFKISLLYYFEISTSGKQRLIIVVSTFRPFFEFMVDEKISLNFFLHTLIRIVQ